MPVRYIYAALLFLMAVVLLPLPGTGAAEREVAVLNVEGPIVPVVERYIIRGISEAEETGAEACIITLNTPGGLYHTTQGIVQEILNAEVPVVVYVSPAGGWAGSAGTFITIAAHVAAMAPGSRIGAAHPVAGEGQELSPTQAEKITQDAAAWARSIAESRGRNGAKAALAVTESRSYTDKEALKINLIDLRSPNLETLLKDIDGREIILNSGKRIILDTEQANLRRSEMTASEKFLHTVSDPNVAYILLSLGMLGLVVELFHPGLIFPGVTGGISLLVALYSLGTLDASWSGVLLMLLGFALFVAELFVTSFGLLTLGGIIALTAGSLMLFSQGSPMPQVSFGVIAGVVVSISAFMVFALQAIIKAQRKRATTGLESFIGAKGEALTDLNPEGTVLFQGERWKAVAEDGVIEAGAEVTVNRVEGLRLYVRKRQVSAGNEG
ncbi:MAG: nodulation protein NfeD [Peptococcaceae bacterium]|nr:nodulation protein NfeD [Peptococcaceae bacterium]